MYTRLGSERGAGPDQGQRSALDIWNSPHLASLKHLESLSRPMPEHVLDEPLAQHRVPKTHRNQPARSDVLRKLRRFRNIETMRPSADWQQRHRHVVGPK